MTRAAVAVTLALLLVAVAARPEPRSARRPAPPATRIDADAARVARDGELARRDPIAFLNACLDRYRREVTGYRCTLDRRERIGKVLRPREVARAAFRERPFAVLMRWETGGAARATLYAEDLAVDRLLVIPAGSLLSLVGPVSRRLDSPDVAAASRFGIREFGMGKGLERTLRAWTAARDAGRLSVEYRGVAALPELNGRPCHVLRRTVSPPEEQGLTELTLGIDAETGLMAYSRLLAGTELIAEYAFRDVELNPAFAPDQFTPAALRGR